jgi:anti-anti-sigma factor
MLTLSRPVSLPVLTYSRVGHAAVVLLAGESIRDEESTVLKGRLIGLASDHKGTIVLDLTQVGTFSCAWINTMLDIRSACTQLGGDLALTGLNRPMRDFFRSTGLEDRFLIANDRFHALALLGLELVSPWRLAVARLLDIPVAVPSYPLSRAA